MNLAHLKQWQSEASYSLVAARNHFYYVSHERGIAPIMIMLKRDRNYFYDCIVVDKIIGKAAAMMLTLSCAKYIHAQLMSTSAMRYLDQHGIPYSYDQSCEWIVNRSGTGMCPMEAAVASLEDGEAAYEALYQKLNQLRKE